MKLFVSYVPSLVHPFYPQQMCREQDSGYSMVMRETEGAVATIELERRQTGWSILGVGQMRCAIVSWTPTGNVADAVVIARGRIVGLPDDLFSPFQTITLECSPSDIEKKLLAWCKTNLADGPETDLLFSDADPESVETYLLGRCGSLVVDPATHAISYSDDIVGETVHDLADAFVRSSSRGVYDPPVRTYRATLACEWTQEAEGTVDVASQLKNFGGAIRTLDASFAGRIASSLSAAGSEGWSTTSGVETETVVSETSPQLVGSTYASVGISRVLVYLGAAQGNGIVRADESAEVRLHDMNPVFEQFEVTVRRFPLAYSYSQQRRDIAFLRLDVPVQDTAAVRDESSEVIDYTLGDIFADASFPQWQEATDYAKGEQVQNGGRYYECVADHHASYFDEDRGVVFRRKIPGTNPPYYESTRTFWLRIRPTSIPTRATMTRFLSTARGERCLRHAMLRLRKEGRRRLRAWHVNVDVEWSKAAAIRITDSASVLVPWDGEGAHRRAVGKVVALERIWNGEGAPIVRLELGIPFGLGGSPSDGTGGNVYVADGYVDEAHFGSTATSDMSIEISADPPSIPVDVGRLNSPPYAVLAADVRNETGDQLSAIRDVLDAGGDITEISVRKATAVKLRMRPISATSEPLEREVDVVGELLVTPSGIDLT